MKPCIKCAGTLPLTSFPSVSGNRDGLSNICRSCTASYQRIYSEQNRPKLHARKKKLADKNRLRMVEYLREHSCVDCGEPDIVVLEFDHLRDKKLNISQMVPYYSWTRILAEVLKCEVVCANCHMRRTASRAGWFKHRHNST